MDCEWLMQLSCTWILILQRPKFSISMPVKVHLLLLPAAALPQVVIRTFQNSSIIIIIIILDGDSAPALTCKMQKLTSPVIAVIGSPIGAPAAVAGGSTASAPQQSDGMGLRTGLANTVAAGGCAALSLLLWFL